MADASLYTMDTKAMFAKKEGKQATKGQRQIYEDNQSTVKFYTYMALAATIFNAAVTLMLGRFAIFWFLFALLNYAVSIASMMYMAKPVFVGGTTAKHVVDGGIDLNLKSGFADHLKDLIIATAFCQIFATFSTFFWIPWFSIPVYFLYLIWINFIWPWFHQPSADEQTEVSDKKKRKMQRKMARTSYR